MQNGFFKLVKTSGGTGLRLTAPVDGGEPIQLQELINYLDKLAIDYDLDVIKGAVAENTDKVYFISPLECPSVRETYQLKISADGMSAIARFYPPSEMGERMNFNEFLNDLRFRNVLAGVQMQTLQDHFMSAGIYCTDLEVAKGRDAIPGQDDRVEYCFNTETHIQPSVREDGTVDYYNLNTINHCKQGEVLARIIRGKKGEAGVNVMGKRLIPREEKHLHFRYGNNIQLSEDGLCLLSKVDGHVMLVDGQVFVSDVYEVENVDLSTGNIEYTGSIQINGNVSSNFIVKAGGNVVIKGVVEGAQITAGGNIIIARGMNGMAKGVLTAGGDVISKFIENATVQADGYVNTESILHSRVSAGLEVTVTGKRGFITGGRVQANQQVTVKNLGAEMGASTIVEVGVDPKKKMEYMQLQKEMTELVQNIKMAQPVLTNFAEKRAKGARFTPDQLKYVKETAVSLEKMKVELETKNKLMQEMQANFALQSKAQVVVKGEVYPGTTIIIGELSTVVQSKLKYCKFENVRGDVKALPL